MANSLSTPTPTRQALAVPALGRPALGPGTLRWEMMPVLKPRRHPSDQLAALSQPRSLAAEQYRRLAVGLQFVRQRRELRSLLLTSAAPGEGKTLSAANLAFTLARPGGQRVLLLEGDLHRPSLLRRLDAAQEHGLADWLEGRAALEECIGHWLDLPLWILPAARPSRQPLELLQVSPPEQLLQQLEPHFDWVVVDSPPLLATADAGYWGHACDGVILVVRRDRTRLSDLPAAAGQIERAKWLGVLLNESSVPDHDYYRHYGA